MSDKPLDATGTMGPVGKHDFVGRVVDGIHFNKSGRAFGRIEVERLIAEAVAVERERWAQATIHASHCEFVTRPKGICYCGAHDTMKALHAERAAALRAATRTVPPSVEAPGEEGRG